MQSAVFFPLLAGLVACCVILALGFYAGGHRGKKDHTLNICTPKTLNAARKQQLHCIILTSYYYL